MDEIPHAVLSEHFQERMQKRRLRAAVFLTYQFEPDFFEQEVLPVFLDTPLSHAMSIRYVQLEEVLSSMPGQIAVYYDAQGLVTKEAASAKLDVRRIPVRHRSGIFHPKNVFALVEAQEADEEGHREQTLLVSSSSANLTRAGWWENVEACHVEEIAEGDSTALRDNLRAFLRTLIRRTEAESSAGDEHDTHAALHEILKFLGESEQRQTRSTSGKLHAHFYGGGESVADFIDNTAGGMVRGLSLEVISPFVDDADECKPLKELIARFEPRDVMVYLPRGADGTVSCREELFRDVCDLPKTSWGKFDEDMLQLGSGEQVRKRFVHAKTYRFFSQRPKREIYFIGSANLTTAAHQKGGNVETGFLVDVTPARAPEFWLKPLKSAPGEFKPDTEDQTREDCGSRLRLRYHWDKNLAEAYWDSNQASPALTLNARGVTIGELGVLEAQIWTPLGDTWARKFAEVLRETSLLRVRGESDPPPLVLVQEEGMSHKPSLLLELSAADILRYWSLLTPAQRAAFIETRAVGAALDGQGAELVARVALIAENDTLFDRFAGVFHAFGCLERAVITALKEGNEKDATYRLFGKKYDSLGTLLDRILPAENTPDEDVQKSIDHYIIVLCARQLCGNLRREFVEFWTSHREDVIVLNNYFERADRLHNTLLAHDPEKMQTFLPWFEKWFLKQVRPSEPSNHD